jgi:hypothetical protein
MNRRTVIQTLLGGLAVMFSPLMKWLDRKEDAWFKGTEAGKRLEAAELVRAAYAQDSSKIRPLTIREVDDLLRPCQLDPQMRMAIKNKLTEKGLMEFGAVPSWEVGSYWKEKLDGQKNKA